MKKFNSKLVALAAVVMTFVLAMGMATPALAKNELDATDAGLQVSDATTYIEVAKLDPDTQEYVKGATMQIIVKDTGEVVDEWVSTDKNHKNSKGLNVNVHYILREISAPDGYEVAKDTEFYIDETEGVGIHIVSGDSAELTQSTTVKLYDKAIDTETETVVTKSNKKRAPQTGDSAPVVAVAVGILVCLIAISVLQRIKKKSASSEE